MAPAVKAFFDDQTSTVSYVVHEPQGRACAIIDSVLDFDRASGRTATGLADQIVDYVRSHDLKVEWILESHVHADHLSAAPYLQQELGGKIGIAPRSSLCRTRLAKSSTKGPSSSAMAANSTRDFRKATVSKSARCAEARCTPQATPRPA